jgi:DNA-binding transcriptional ArsR family regulator
LRTPHISDQIINEVSEIFGALADVSRLKILRTLLDAGEPLSQGALVERTGLSQANASKHLSHLVRVGLVTREPDGNTVYFQPVMPLVGNVCEIVCGHVTDRVTAAYKALR